MKTLETIFKRRSIRQYIPKAVKEEDLATLLKAAMAAPTARNCQEWEFIVVRNTDTFKQMIKAHPYAQALQGADCAIVVCGNLQREYAPGYWTADCGAATQNLLLAVTELGLGAVWMGIYPDKERMSAFRKILQLPDYVLPLNIISVGYPATQGAEVDRFDPAKVHYEKW